MSPVATSAREDLLEHPEQAFAAYRSDGVAGRAVRGEAHGLARGAAGLPLPARRPGPVRRRLRPAHSRGADLDPDRPAVLPARPHRGPGRPPCARRPRQAGLFDELGTRWLLLDAELLPWNVKAGQLLRDQYAAVGAAARAALPAAVGRARAGPGPDLPADGPAVTALLDRTRARAGERRRLHRRLPALLLGHRRPGRRARRPVPGARLRGSRLPRAPAPLAPGGRRPAGRRRPGPDHHHPAARGGDRRSRLGRRGHPVVGGPDRRRGRGHGGQARREPDPRPGTDERPGAWSSRA